MFFFMNIAVTKFIILIFIENTAEEVREQVRVKLHRI